LKKGKSGSQVECVAIGGDTVTSQTKHRETGKKKAPASIGKWRFAPATEMVSIRRCERRGESKVRKGHERGAVLDRSLSRKSHASNLSSVFCGPEGARSPCSTSPAKQRRRKGRTVPADYKRATRNRGRLTGEGTVHLSDSVSNQTLRKETVENRKSGMGG